MLKQFITALGIVALAVIAVQPAGADDVPGAGLFQTYCAACHGPAGSGGAATAIGTAQYLGSHTDDELAKITGDGIEAEGMPAWSQAKGGALTDDQIAEIVAYLRSLASGPATEIAPAPTAASSPSATEAAPTPTAAASPVPVKYSTTKLAVSQSFNDDGKRVVTAQLRKSDNTAGAGAPIVFERGTSFGTVDLGTVKTDESGAASLVILEVPESARVVDILFKGDPSLGSSAARIVLQPTLASVLANGTRGGVQMSVGDAPLLSPDGSLITPNPPLLPAMLFLLVVLGVWLTYGYVVFQVIAIRNSKPRTRSGYPMTKEN